LTQFISDKAGHQKKSSQIFLVKIIKQCLAVRNKVYDQDQRYL